MKTILITFSLAGIATGLSALERVSVDVSGGQLAAESRGGAVSRDGRYVAFQTDTDILPSDTNGHSDVYRLDRTTGDLIVVSVNTSNIAANGNSSGPQISDDGSVVAFGSFATDLTATPANEAQIFVRDLGTGTTTLVSSREDGSEPNDATGSFVLSGDGQWVAFDSQATDIVRDDDNGKRDIFLVEVGDPGTVERISGGEGLNQSDGHSDIEDITPDGRFVVFSSIATNLVTPATGTTNKLYRFEKETGETLLLTLSTLGGEPSDYCETASVSADGRYIAFESDADNLVVDDANDDTDVFLYDVNERLLTLASRNSTGDQGDGSHNLADGGGALSDDGRYLVFHSYSTNLADIANHSGQLYQRDLRDGATELLSKNAAEDEADGPSSQGRFSGDGNHVVFESRAENLVDGDTNMVRDIFLWSRPVPPAVAAPDNSALRAALLRKLSKLKKKARAAKKKGKKANAKKFKKKAKKVARQLRSL